MGWVQVRKRAADLFRFLITLLARPETVFASDEPFSELLYQLRCHYDVWQTELAERLGYEQSYISALEIGLKGPPMEEFVQRMEAAVPLTPTEDTQSH